MAVQRLKEQERRQAGPSKGTGYYLIQLKKLWNFSIATAELRGFAPIGIMAPVK
jgi:hypothetical protein